MEIYTTKDYDKFVSITSNRDVDKNHVRNLARSIKSRNLLHLKPLIVNERMELIDGQHRLEACKQMKEPVYYIKVQGVTKTDIAILNSAQKNWTREDFINFYAIEGRPDFKTLASLINKYDLLKVGFLLKACGNSPELRNGKLNLVNITRCRQVCDWIMELYGAKYRFAITAAFCNSLNEVCRTDVEFKKIKNAGKALVQCGSQMDYTKILRKILE